MSSLEALLQLQKLGGAGICSVVGGVFSGLGALQVQCLEDSLEPAPVCQPCDAQDILGMG